MTTILYLSRREKEKIKRWLQDQVEYVGVVIEYKNGRVAFPATMQIRHPHLMTSFHTHPMKESKGGFSPPSIKDMNTVLTWWQTRPLIPGKRRQHYVISHRGVYILNNHCAIATKKRKTLVRELKTLRSIHLPSTRHHRAWLNAVNHLAPQCLYVKYTPWQQCYTRTPPRVGPSKR